jgi:hypothetical protein
MPYPVLWIMFCVTTLFVSSSGVGLGHNWIFSPNRNHLKNKVIFGDVKVDVEVILMSS